MENQGFPTMANGRDADVDVQIGVYVCMPIINVRTRL
jgi:hypothetical protein